MATFPSSVPAFLYQCFAEAYKKSSTQAGSQIQHQYKI